MSFFLLTVLFVACSNPTVPKRDISNHIEPPPPPLSPAINSKEYCQLLKQKKVEVLSNGNIYLLYDSVNLWDRIVFEKILYDKYKLLALPILEDVDRVCIKPVFDSIILRKFTVKNTATIIEDVNKDVEILKRGIGNYQVSKGMYFTANQLPKYPDGLPQLQSDILTLKNNYKRTSTAKGRVMFYFTLDTFGVVTDVAIYEHLDRETDSLTIEIMKHLPQKWSPAKLNDRSVSFWKQYGIDW
jgi:hypothetical protein